MVPHYTHKLVLEARVQKSGSRWGTALSSALSLVLVAAGCTQGVSAADFTRSQKTYVPPTLIDRRVDFTALREHQAVEPTTPPAKIVETGKQAKPKISSANLKGIARTTKPISNSKSNTTPPQAVAPTSTLALAKASAALRQRLKTLAASPQTAAQLASIRQQAEQYAASGKFDQAKSTIAKALQLSSHDKALLHELSAVSIEKAKLLSNSQQFDQAAHYARQALSIDSNSAEANQLLNNVLKKSGENPDDAGHRLNNARQLAAQGRNEEAAVEYTAALKLEPSAEAHIGIGDMAMRNSQQEVARHAYTQALELNPNSAVAHRQLGMLKYSTGDLVGANGELSRALILDPNDSEAAHNLVDLWQRQVSRAPNVNSHLGLARAYQLAGDLQSAQTEYRTVVQLDPQHPHLPAARQAFKLALAQQEARRAATTAHVLENQGAYSDAYGKIIEAQRMSPGDADLRVNQGRILEKLQNPAAARRAYLDALKLNPQHNEAISRLQSLAAGDTQAINPTGMASSSASTAPVVASAAMGMGAMTAMGQDAADPVGQLSNFAIQLRNHVIVQKATMQKVEDTAHDLIAKAGNGGGLGAPAGAGTVYNLDGGSLPEIAAGSADISAGSLDGTLASAASAIAKAKGLTGGEASVSRQTASAIAKPIFSQKKQPNAKGKQSAYSAAPLNFGDTTAHNLVSQAPAQASTLSPVLAGGGADMIQGAYPGSGIMQPSSQLMAPVGTIEPAAMAQPYPSSADASMPPLAPPIAITMPVQQQRQAIDILSMNGLTATRPAAYTSSIVHPSEASTPQLRPAVSSVPQVSIPVTSEPTASVPAMLNMSPTGTQSVKLSLETANVNLTGVELCVVLRNDGDTSLSIPDKMHAVIKYNNRKDAEVKANFATQSVPPHGSVRGSIKVPFDKVDPNADLILPNLLPPGCSNRDIHLITSMAMRR